MPARREAAPLTRSVEDYLKTIYELARDGEAAATTDIAARLRVAPASVSGMVRRLAAQGLVTVTRYKGARLTPQGRRAALQLLRRHRILEVFLVTQLGYGWDEVHDEAERLEHAASPALIERMAAALGHPVADPHGAPIPSADGRVDDSRLQTVNDLAPGERARVMRMSDRDPALLRYLAGLGIRPGVELRLVSRAPFDGPLTVEVAGVPHALGASLTGQLFITKINPSAPGTGRRR